MTDKHFTEHWTPFVESENLMTATQVIQKVREASFHEILEMVTNNLKYLAQWNLKAALVLNDYLLDELGQRYVDKR